MFLRLATVQKHIGPAIVVVDATVAFAVVIAAAVVVVVVVKPWCGLVLGPWDLAPESSKAPVTSSVTS